VRLDLRLPGRHARGKVLLLTVAAGRQPIALQETLGVKLLADDKAVNPHHQATFA